MRPLTSLFARPLAGEHASRIVRPRIPPVLACALMWYAASAAAYTLLQDATVFACKASCIASLCAALAVCIYAFRTKRVMPVCLSLGLLMGLAGASYAALTLHVRTDALVSAESGEYVFEVKEDAQSGTYGAYCICEEEASGALVRVYVPDEFAHMRYGDVFSARVSWSVPSDASAGTFWRLGHACSAKATRIAPVNRTRMISPLLHLRNATLDSLFAEDAGDAGMIARALLCGYRSGLTGSSIYLDFQTAGLAHMIAVSGAHLTLVCGVIAACLSRLKVRRNALCVIELLAIGCYIVIAAAPVSALRAAVMACTALMSFFARRRKASLNALGLSMIFLMALHPQNCVSISFTLSVVATFGIIVFFPLVSDWLADWMAPVPAAVRDTIALTLTANLCTIPLSAAMFSKVSLIAPLSNCLCAPLLLATCTVGCVVLIVSCIVPPLGGIGALAAQGCTRVFCWVVHALASIPYACIAVSLPLLGAIAISAAACFSLWLFWPRIGLRAACCFCAGVAACAMVWMTLASFLVGTRIVMIDVGQGDAFLVQSGRKSVLIDTGNNQSKLLSGLARLNVRHIDCVIISHSDDDHCGCLHELCSSVDVGAIVLDEWVPACGCHACTSLMRTSEELFGADRIKTVGIGDELRFGAFVLEVVWPDAFAEQGGNADSLCLVASADVDGDGSADYSALLCGDAESEQLMRMVELGRLPRIDILKVGHHGSKDAVDGQLLQILQPRIALISVGKGNVYGHPAAQTLEALGESGVRVYRSDESGTVACKLESSMLIVSPLG